MGIMGNNNSNSYKYNNEKKSQTHNINSNTLGQTHKLQSTYNRQNLLKKNQNTTLKYQEMFLKLNKVRKKYNLRDRFDILNNNFQDYKKSHKFELYKTYFSLWQVYKNRVI